MIREPSARSALVLRGRPFSRATIVRIRKLIRANPTAGRTKISELVCRELEWYQPNGRLKDRACRVALLELERRGLVDLPPRLLERGGRPPLRGHVPPELVAEPVLTMPRTIDVRLVASAREARLWNGLVASHHYIGLRTPVGRVLRYLVHGDGRLVAAFGFGEPAWALKPRDELLKALMPQLRDPRTYVVGNNRFLVLPNVRVKNLASRLLAAVAREVPADWERLSTVRPLLMETFVDTRRFAGTCYLASNWKVVGETAGFTKRGNVHVRSRSPKLLLMYGLTRELRSDLERLSLV